MSSIINWYVRRQRCKGRKDKIFIVPYRDPEAPHKFWRALPPRKPVCPGQTVTWRVFGIKAKQVVTINLPADVFTPAGLKIEQNQGEAKAKVKSDAPQGDHVYHAFVDRDVPENKVHGDSDPSVIVDWR